ncbi:hypothetical protein [Propionivibrio sp.]|uniref:hypothetical protein n=1 Tax=Propionivibrio sp. TaxID=2212460 RepID=UPI003BF3ED84
MKITTSQFEAWQASPAIHEWFLLRFPEGEAKYQDILTALAEDERPNEAHWLMENAGTDDCACLDVTNLEAHKHVFAAGKLSVVGTLSVSGWIRAGLSIEADKSLSADLGIIAGWNIRAGGSLRTNGEIRAGSRIDAGRNITAGDCITSAFAIVAGGDIRAGKEINSGTDFELMGEAVEALNNDDSDDSRKKWINLQKLWAASSGSDNYWDAIVGDRSPFGIEASGDIVAGTAIVSVTSIKAGDSIMAGEAIQAGRTIHAGGNVTAGRGINGAWKLSAEGSIQSGTEIIAATIHAGGGITAQGDILFTADLESGSDIAVSGNIRSCEDAKFCDISTQGELRVGGEILCSGYILAARIDAGDDLIAGRGIRTDGDIIAGKELVAGRYIMSRFGSIRAGLGIKAGEAIQAARSIQASREIVAGADCGIFAATALKLSDWVANGQVVAKTRPENLISGYWVMASASDEPTLSDTGLETGNPPAVSLPASGVRLVQSTGPYFSNDHSVPSSSNQIEWHEEWADLSDGIVIKVIGVGGAGGNAVDHMIREGVQGVEFIVADTDELGLRRRLTKSRLQLGQANLGASDHMEAHRNTAMQERNRISQSLKGAHMVFIVAGMGGVTGTGFVPIIAEVARELGILTVAVVTSSHGIEGKRINIVEAGIAELRKHVHCLIVIRNDVLIDMLNTGVSIDRAFKEANNLLRYAVGGIAENINFPGLVNPDFKDVRAVMAGMGIGMMGSAIASGDDRARIAAERALASPLLENNLSTAKGVIVNIVAIRGLKMAEVNQVINTIREFVADDAQIIFGAIYDERIGEDIRVTVIAVGHPSPLLQQ